MSKQDNTITGEEKEETIQTGIRIPLDLYKTVGKEAIDRGTTQQQLWIDAMRKFLKLTNAA